MPTKKEVRKEFALQGVSVSEWALRNGFSPTLVYQVLSGNRKAIRGKSHQIAVRLGLKDGEMEGIEGLSFEKNRPRNKKSRAPKQTDHTSDSKTAGSTLPVRKTKGGNAAT